jgi:hypothetical protein
MGGAVNGWSKGWLAHLLAVEGKDNQHKVAADLLHDAL